jgi:hypothetical protein
MLPLMLLIAFLLTLAQQLGALQPELKAAQQERVLAQQEAQASARNQIPTTQPGASALPSANRDEYDRQQRNKEIEIQGKILYWTRILAITAIVFGVLQGVLLIFQSIYTGKAATAASSNALSAQRSTEIAAYTLRVSSRAQLVVSGSNVKYDSSDESFKITAYFWLKNVGKSTARLTSTNIDFMIGSDTALPNEPTFRKAADTDTLVIAPSDERLIAREMWPKNKGLIEAAKSGKNEVFVWSTWSYRDDLLRPEDADYRITDAIADNMHTGKSRYITKAGYNINT